MRKLGWIVIVLSLAACGAYPERTETPKINGVPIGAGGIALGHSR